MYRSTVRNSVAYPMLEISKVLPKMTPSHGLKKTASDFLISWEFDSLEIKIAHQNLSVSLLHLSMATIVLEEKSSSGVCSTV